MLRHKEHSLERMRHESSFEQATEDMLTSLQEENSMLQETIDNLRNEYDAALMELAALMEGE